ncbi:MAG: DNA internalization-related competence protein ComEC/Rec2, partial [Nitrospirae bacterium]|nr:DNA internalization-related competence protein ComEC/Rec2 [Nitrospirota bacterium]
IITGERSLLTKEMNNAFNVTGLAHILSISGAHFGLLFFFLFKTFRFLINRIPYKALVRLTLYFTPSQVASVLCMPFMIGYLGISTTSFPAIRSFIMILLFLFGLLLQRKGFYLNTLLFAAFIIVLMQPDSILDLSFQLSFIAVLCIGIVAEKIGNKDRQGDRVKFYSAAVSHLRSSMLISIAATAGTAPLVAYYFHYFSLVSPLTNLVFTPVIGFIILPISLVSSFIFLVFGAFPLHSLIDAITRFVLESIAYVAQWKFVDVRIPAFPLILLIMFYLGILAHVLFDIRKDRQPTGNNKASQNKASGNDYLLSIVLPMSIAVVPIIFFSGSSLFGQKGIKITHLDVGQGDAAVVELPDKRTLVMDTGKSGFQVGEFLRYRGIREIEAVVISHGQFDHAGGVRYLLNNFQVNEIWDNDLLVYKAGFPNGVRHRGLNRGDITEGRGYRIAALHPYNGFYPGDSKDSDENNDSLVLEIQGRNNSFLFTGDIEKAAEENLAYLGDYLKSSVLKVPHHGSRSSASEAFFRAVSPKIAVISAGRRNMYGHPHSETIEMLGNAKILRTDRDGAIGISELPDGRLKVRTWGEFQFSEAKSLEDEVMNFKRLFWIW